MIEIIHGFDIPARVGNRKYPWKELGIGDAFEMPLGSNVTIRGANITHAPKEFRGVMKQGKYFAVRVK